MERSTRIGFADASFLETSTKIEANERRSSRTVYGREIHLSPTAFVPASVPARALEKTHAKPNIPSHSGKTGLPALVGFWGRRNTAGELVPLTDGGFGRVLDGARATPDRLGFFRHATILLAAAILSFVAVAAAMRLGRSTNLPLPELPTRTTSMPQR